MAADLRDGRGRARRLHGVARRPRLAPGAAGQPAGRRAARRARRRLRRQLLPRRAARVQRGQPAPVHALRHLADGHLLQQGAHRLREDDPARARRARPQRGRHPLVLRPVRRRGRLRHAPPAPHPRRARRPHAAQPRAVRLLRWRGAVRRRGGAHVAGVLRRGHPRRPGAHARAAPRPAADAQRAAARPGDAAHLVQARSARHDRGLPVAGARAADRAGPGVRRDADADAGRRRHRRRHHRPLPLGRRPRTPPRPPTSWSTRSPPRR